MGSYHRIICAADRSLERLANGEDSVRVITKVWKHILLCNKDSVYVEKEATNYPVIAKSLGAGVQELTLKRD